MYKIPLFSLRFYTSEVNKSLLLKLRRITGYTFSACREALVKNNNDIEKAQVWLSDEAVRRGWAKAGKLAGRSMSQGLLGVLANRTRAVIVEVNCETDFVSRNDAFQNFVASASEVVMKNFVVSDFILNLNAISFHSMIKTSTVYLKTYALIASNVRTNLYKVAFASGIGIPL